MKLLVMLGIGLLLVLVRCPSLADRTPLTLNWQDNSTNETGFSNARCDGIACQWEEIAQVGPNVTTYVGMTATEGIYYGYRVRAFIASNPAVLSAYSNADYGQPTGGSFIHLPPPCQYTCPAQ